MKNFTRTLALMLALVMVIGALSGCTPKTDSDPAKPDNTNPSGPKAEDNPAISDPEGYTYVASYSKLNSNEDGMYYDVRYAAGKLWYTTSEYVNDPVYDENGNMIGDNGYQVTYLWNMDTDGSNITKLEGFEAYKPDEEGWDNASSYIQSISDAGDGNIWAVESYYASRNTAPEGVEPYSEQWYNYQEYKNGAVIAKLGPDGSALATIDSSVIAPDADYFYVNGLLPTKDGKLIAFSDMTAYVLSAEGEVLGKISSDSYFGTVVALRDGTIVTRNYEYNELDGTGKEVWKALDVDNFKLGDDYDIPSKGDIYNYVTGTGDYDLYGMSSTGIYGVKLSDGTCEEIVNYINSDIDMSDIGNITPLDDGTFFAISSTWNDQGMEMSVVNIHPVKNSEIPVRTVLTFACMYLNYNVRRQILNFNRSNDKYRIKVIDYSQYNTENDWEAGLTKLTTELLAGNIPDMFDINQLPVTRLAAKGYLEELTPWIEQDTGIGGMAGLVAPIMNAVKDADGKLWYTVPTAYLSTVMAPTSLVGDLVRTNPDGSVYWTISDLMEAYKRMPQGADIFSKYTNASDMLSELTGYMMDDLINWSTGECKFDSPDFVAALEFCNLFRKTPYDWEKEYDPNVDDSELTRFREGRQMLWSTQVNGFTDWRQYDRLFGGATFVGYPVSSGSGSAWNISNNGTIAMSSRCSDKEGAWSFMRYFFTEEFQSNNYGIPTNKAVFDKMLNDACTPQYEDNYDENGNVIGKVEIPKDWYWYGEGGGGIVYEDDVAVAATKQAGTITGPSEQYPAEQCFFAMTEEERAKIESVINSTTRLNSADESIVTIILEEAAPYFDGKQSSQQTADTIQRRINLYVNEQR